jgi:hypothetical protein
VAALLSYACTRAVYRVHGCERNRNTIPTTTATITINMPTYRPISLLHDVVHGLTPFHAAATHAHRHAYQHVDRVSRCGVSALVSLSLSSFDMVVGRVLVRVCIYMQTAL